MESRTIYLIATVLLLPWLAAGFFAEKWILEYESLVLNSTHTRSNMSITCAVLVGHDGQILDRYFRRETQINGDSHSCSFGEYRHHPLEESSEEYTYRTFECTGASTVAVKTDISEQVRGIVGLQIQCEASFPLDLDVDFELPFRKTVTLDKVGDRFRVHTACIPTEMYTWSTSLASNPSVISRKFTVYTVSDSTQNITLEFTLTHEYDLEAEASSAELRLYIIFSSTPYRTVSLIYCKNKRHLNVYLACAAGKNPTETKLLRRCLQPGISACPEEIHKGDYHDPDVSLAISRLPHGLAYCRRGSIEALMEYFTPVGAYKASDNISLIWDAENVIHAQMDDGLEILYVPYTKRLPSHFLHFYESEWMELECHFLEYFLRLPITWVAVYSNGSEQNLYLDDLVFKEEKVHRESQDVQHNISIHVSSSRVKIQAEEAMASIECRADYWNYAASAKAILSVNITGLSFAIPPWFRIHEFILLYTLGSYLQLNCSVDLGTPQPKYNWKFLPGITVTVTAQAPNASTEMYSISTIIQNGKQVSTLTIPSFGVAMQGEYICFATNIRGNGSQHFRVELRDESLMSAWVYFGIAVVSFILIGMILVCLSIRYHTHQGRLTATEISLFEKGNQEGLRIERLAHENAQFMPYNREYEIRWEDFRIFENEKLGQGEFGAVFKGCLSANTSHAIAIKTLKEGAEKCVLLALLSELKIMMYIGSHENVIKFVGSCTEFLTRGRLYILIEYSPIGSVESYIRRSDITAFIRNPLVAHTPVSEDAGYLSYNAGLTIKDLVGWAVQVARGMQHLQSKKVIHGDLAARNVLLFSKTRVKITDFGLSLQILNYENYVKNSQAKLPWRWLALETLKKSEFSYQSDVWAYGVTLWEIFTLGLIPYPGMRWTTEFVGFLEQNLRLHHPQFASDNIYQIMLRCWDAEPSKRPTFQQLEELLVNLEV